MKKTDAYKALKNLLEESFPEVFHVRTAVVERRFQLFKLLEKQQDTLIGQSLTVADVRRFADNDPPFCEPEDGDPLAHRKAGHPDRQGYGSRGIEGY